MKIDMTPVKGDCVLFEDVPNGATFIDPKHPNDVWMKIARLASYSPNCVRLSDGVPGVVYSHSLVGPGCEHELIAMKIVRDES